MAEILLVDDDLIYLAELAAGLQTMSHNVITATSVEEARICLDGGGIGIIICDTIMAGGGALSLLHDVQTSHPHVPFIVITGLPEIATSPLFQSGMSEASAKIEKTASLVEIDKLIRTLLR